MPPPEHFGQMHLFRSCATDMVVWLMTPVEDPLMRTMILVVKIVSVSTNLSKTKFGFGNLGSYHNIMHEMYVLCGVDA